MEEWCLDSGSFLVGDEVVSLRRAARPRRGFRAARNCFVVELGLETGLRVMEMSGLRCADLRCGHLPEVVVECGKGKKRRVVKVSRRFCGVMARFLERKRRAGECVEPGAPLFRGRKGALCRRQLQKVFERIARRAGLDVSIHALRHTYGTHLLRASGGNLRLVQKQLGHSRITTTQVYADVIDEDARAAVEQLYREPRRKRR